MRGNFPGRVKRAHHSLPASASAAGVPSRHRTSTSTASTLRAAARSGAVRITCWAEDHAEAVIPVPLVVLLCAAGAAYIWRPATTTGVIIFLAALIAVTGAAFGGAKRALSSLRRRRDDRQQALLPGGSGQFAAAGAGDRGNPLAIPEDAQPGDPA